VNLQQWRWPVLMVSFGLTLGLLFGASLLIKTHTVDSPIEALLRASPVVANETLTHQGDRIAITVTLKNTDDLQRDYTALSDAVRKVAGDTPFTMKVADGRTPELEALDRRLNLYVQEALSTGHFAQMADQVTAEAAKAGAQASFTVDTNRLYLSIKSGGAYLYDVVDRPQTSPTQTVLKGGLGM